jgi:hypothetical protein
VPGLLEAPAEPAAEQAPLSGFAQAITGLGGSDDVPTEPPVGAAGDDRPAAGPTIQRLTADREPPVGSDSPPDAPAGVTSGLVSPSTAPPAVAALPVVSRLASAAGPAGSIPSTSAAQPESRVGAPASHVDDAPTLGIGLVQ